MNRAVFLVAVVALGAFDLACTQATCDTGQTRPCYTGPEHTANRGLCRDGVEQCVGGRWSGECVGEVLPSAEYCDSVDNDCDGEVDEGTTNACGGCSTLEAQPGAECGECAVWACDSGEAVSCVPPEPALGSECETDDGCLGTLRCERDGSVQCRGPRRNECGACGGPSLPQAGEACVADNGCLGVYSCSVFGDSLYCDAPPPNNCGVCGRPDVPDIGGACQVAGNTCIGQKVCNSDGTDFECAVGQINACNACGPVLSGEPGDACGQPGPCAGQLACSTTGDALICTNDVLGTDCTGANGCGGYMVCNASGDGVECRAPEKNACGACGAGPSEQELGQTCTTIAGCPGVTECNDSGNDVRCRETERCGPDTDHVVISEFAPAGPGGADDEFVELYNPLPTETDVGGYTVWYRPPTTTSSGNFFLMATIPAGTRMPPGGYYLLGGRTYSGPPADASFKQQQLSGDGGQIWLTKSDIRPQGSNPRTDPNVADLLGYGTAKVFEGTAATRPATAGSLERKAKPTSTAASMSPGGVDELAGNGLDTDNNRNDFVLRSQREPQNRASPTER